MSEPDLSTPLPQLARELRSGQRKARALIEVALGRAEADRFGAYREFCLPQARITADAVDLALKAGCDPGPLAGIPLSVKDLYGVPGTRTFAGTSEALPERFEAPGPLLRRALGQLGPIVGKTHTVEFAFGGIGANAHWGTPRNPHCETEHRVPGGSSSGAGPSLFEGSARIAFGTDTAGSVRIPAAWTGHAGLKTTKGRWSTAGIVPLSSTLDTAGVLTRSVEDLAYAFYSLDGPAASFSDRFGRHRARDVGSLRLGFATGLFREDCSPGVLETVLAALFDLESAGARVGDLELPGLVEATAIFDVGGPTAAELHQFLAAELPAWLPRLEERVRARVQSGGTLLAGEYLRRLQVLEQAHRRAMQVFEDVDVVVTTTVANSPPASALMDSDHDRYRQENLLSLRNTGVVSLLGLCAVSLPCGRDAAGMPVGLQLVGPACGEERLLAVAAALETALGPRL